jgi:hypothetical protein
MKKFLLYAIVIAMAGSVSAFVISTGKERVSQLWYEFVGTDANNPLHYQLLGDGSQAPSCNASTSNRCAVKAEPNETYGEDYPELSDPGIEIRNKD